LLRHAVRPYTLRLLAGKAEVLLVSAPTKT
jgi:hypothetical protein